MGKLGYVVLPLLPKRQIVSEWASTICEKQNKNKHTNKQTKKTMMSVKTFCMLLYVYDYDYFSVIDMHCIKVSESERVLRE